jgi:pyruvate/2-oxoglutarate/acetoin dehydrogenase E1 component
LSSAYFDALKAAMNALGAKNDTIFLGQAVQYKGTAMRETLTEIDSSKLLEMPVEEDMQLGVSIGLALHGFVPISIFPRWNFLLLATNQLVNHLDKLKEMTNLEVPPKVIVRTGIGSVKPLDPGPQHKGDFTEPFKLMAPSINVVRLDTPDQVIHEYIWAYERTDGVSTILVEVSDKLND